MTKIMKKFILSIVALTAVAVAFAQESTERNEWLPSFESVVLKTDASVRFVYAPDSEAPKIVYDTKGSTTTKFTVAVTDNVLRITEKIDSYRTERTTVTIYYNALKSLTVSDATVTFEGVVKAGMLDLTVGGRAGLTAEFDVQDLEMELTGNSTATLSGKARYFSLYATTSKLDASAMEVMSAVVNVQSKADVKVNVTERLSVTTATGGVVNYTGKPAIVRTTKKMFAGEIKAVE